MLSKMYGSGVNIGKSGKNLSHYRRELAMGERVLCSTEGRIWRELVFWGGMSSFDRLDKNSRFSENRRFIFYTPHISKHTSHLAYSRLNIRNRQNTHQPVRLERLSTTPVILILPSIKSLRHSDSLPIYESGRGENIFA
jgi:hypothetical protein